MKREFMISVFAFMFIFLISGVLADTTSDPTVCCEKTKTGLFCQNVPQSQCADGFKMAPTSCDSTSFCRPGVCYSPKEGTCTDNTPKIVCNAGNSTWYDGVPAQCNLGCCTLGDQAAFVSLVRCKRLAGSLGIPLSYDKTISDEVSCVLSVKNQDHGACVYESDFEKNCKFETRGECLSGVNGTGAGTFYKDKLCTAEELGTICEKTDKTMCVPGKEGVYFQDTCGNPANIYDSSKVNDLAYWTNVIQPSDSKTCQRADSTCGNCDYLTGTMCGAKSTGSDTMICKSLNCATTSLGVPKLHGESWCSYSAGTKDDSNSEVGSRYYKHLCINGEEVVEPCADFRQEECLQDSITVKSSAGTKTTTFSQAACRVNRWQDCRQQTKKEDCINTDKRDCLWSDGFGCLAKNPPGLNFWEGTTASDQCGKGSTSCTITYEKTGLFGKWECKSGCDCEQNGWVDSQMKLCNALGDCGTNINWLGKTGYGTSYNLTFSNWEEQK